MSFIVFAGPAVMVTFSQRGSASIPLGKEPVQHVGDAILPRRGCCACRCSGHVCGADPRVAAVK